MESGSRVCDASDVVCGFLSLSGGDDNGFGIGFQNGKPTLDVGCGALDHRVVEGRGCPTESSLKALLFRGLFQINKICWIGVAFKSDGRKRVPFEGTSARRGLSPSPKRAHTRFAQLATDTGQGPNISSTAFLTIGECS